MPTRATMFQTQLKTKILNSLENEALTMAEIAKRQDLNYHTVRKWVNILKDEGHIRQIYNGNARDIKYTLGEDTNANGIIPIINTKGSRNKAHLLMQYYKVSITASELAVRNLPFAVTRLMRAANMSYTDNINIDHSLSDIRTELENNRELLQNMVSILDQLLQNPKFWDPRLLSRFPLDATWDEDLLKAALEHYFPKG